VSDTKVTDQLSVLTPLKALKTMILGSYERERLTPSGGAGTGAESKSDAGVFERFSSQVRAAQRAGELSPVDAGLLTALILGAVVGAADLSRQVQSKSEGRTSEAECPALTLLNLLTTRKCN
jgi:hypothetical protein